MSHATFAEVVASRQYDTPSSVLQFKPESRLLPQRLLPAVPMLAMACYNKRLSARTFAE